MILFIDEHDIPTPSPTCPTCGQGLDVIWYDRQGPMYRCGLCVALWTPDDLDKVVGHEEVV